MSDEPNRAELEEEIRRLRVINEVLIQRVEREMDPTASTAFSLFYNTVATDSSVSHRTATLTNLARRLVQEIAERKEAETALLHAKAAAEQANESKTNFLAAVSHDLRQPLHAARLYLGEVSQNPLPAREGALIEGAEVALNAMDDMLESLLDMARLDSGSWRVEPEIFALEPVLARLIAETQATAKQAGLRLRYVPTSALVQTDRRLLERAVRNLIGNALRYTDRGGVLVGCRPRGGHVRIDVVDTGIGIAREKWPVIFQDFHQIGAPARQGGKGLGLGLGLVERAARLIGATVEIDSEPGRGSRFSIALLRLAQAEIPLPSIDPFAGAPAAANGIVLVVEDDPLVRAAISSLLGSWQCQVIAMDSARAALAHLRLYGIMPRAVIVDYHLQGGENGIAAAASLREQCGGALPVLLMSGDRSSSVRMMARDAGMVLLSKPIAPSKLRSALTFLFAQADGFVAE